LPVQITKLKYIIDKTVHHSRLTFTLIQRLSNGKKIQLPNRKFHRAPIPNGVGLI
jgi:hypothetical protein